MPDDAVPDDSAQGHITGLLLAAGRGRRAGGPKALRVDPDGLAWVVRTARVLRAGGCDSVVVVVGAAAGRVRSLLADEGVGVVESPDWEQGMGASLGAGLDALVATAADAALVHLVDLPDVGADVVARVLGHARTGVEPDRVLARASYADGAGHPVLIGRTHWAGVAASATGDRGARGYLDSHPVVAIDCSDLAGGLDSDT
ncbi:MAG: NTP transferase domain-containing protein [Nocardioidaceae bacterium]|nr:NTP transferase domain-containing protein [Nocardioidaceae bacterium]